MLEAPSHIFSPILELHFCSGIDVAIEEVLDCLCFIAETNGISNAGAHAVEIYHVSGAAMTTKAGSVQASFRDLDSNGGAIMGGGPLVVGRWRLC